MNAKYMAWLYEYNVWANHKILSAAEPLSVAQFTTAVFPHHKSLRGTLTHTFSVEWLWLSRWQGISPTAGWREDEFPNFESLAARWRRENQNLRAFMTALRDEDLERIVQYTNFRSQAMAFPLWQLIAHLFNHGTQHRAEAAAMLTELEHSPGDMDMSLFAQQKSL